MSKLLEGLQQSESHKTAHEELINTYFSTSQAETPRNPNASPFRRLYLILVSAAVILAFSFIAIVFYSDRVVVSVNVVKNRMAPIRDLSKKDVEELTGNLVFYGNTSDKSKWTNNYILLAVKGGSKKAIVGIKFQKPKDISGGKIVFYAKTNSSLCTLSVSLKDRDNAECRSANNLLSPTWQKYVIPTKRIANVINTGQIIRLDFEASNQGGKPDEVFLKNVVFKKL